MTQCAQRSDSMLCSAQLKFTKISELQNSQTAALFNSHSHAALNYLHRYTLPPTATLYLPPPPAPPPRAYCVIFSQDGIDVGIRSKKRALCNFRRLALACRETVQVWPGIASLTKARVSAIGNASHLRFHIAAQTIFAKAAAAANGTIFIREIRSAREIIRTCLPKQCFGKNLR